MPRDRSGTCQGGNIYGIFNLPSDSDRQILATITDGDPDRVANSVAGLVDYCRSHVVAFGHTFQFEDDRYMRESGRVATLLLKVQDANPLSRVPDAQSDPGEVT